MRLLKLVLLGLVLLAAAYVAGYWRESRRAAALDAEKAQVIAHRRGRFVSGVGEPYGDRRPLARGGRPLVARAHEPGARATRRVEAGPLMVDLASYTARVGPDPVELTPLQLQVLALLVENVGSVLSRDDFLNRIWGIEANPTNRTIDNFIVKLRRKVERRPDKPEHILTVYGFGYKLVG